MAGPKRPHSRSNSYDTASSPTSTTKSNTHTAARDSYQLAYPAPVFTDKTLLLKHLLPRRYLQLQKLSPDGRHYEPVIDVISLAPPKDPRRLVSVLKNCLSHLKTHEKCLQFDKRDVLLVKTGEDSAPDHKDDASGHGIERVMTRLESLTERKVLAALRAKNRIVTEDGRVWTASVRPNGPFEFTTTSKHGEKTVARWVPARNRASSRVGNISGAASKRSSVRSMPEAGEPTFNFSLMNPAVRRHPVLATLTPSSLQIKETYNEPISVPGVPGGAMGKNGVVDQPTKVLILATAAWLDLYLRWSPSYRGSSS